MVGGGLDATILLEEVPSVECVDGLFYITDRIGGLVIRRCLRPHTFLALVRRGQSAASEWLASKDTVVDLCQRAAG